MLLPKESPKENFLLETFLFGLGLDQIGVIIFKLNVNTVIAS